MAGTGIVKDERYLNHYMGPSHPECPERLEAVYDMLRGPEMAGGFQEVPISPVDKEILCLVHDRAYIDRLAETAGKEYTYLDPDTQTSPDSYETALLAAGGLCEAVSMVLSGELRNAFALVRPPGHHAEKNRAKGFCLFNNVAVGAEYARARLGLGRILIVDWDVHHGNGTQHTFEQDPGILYFSTHQYPFYPGTGSHSEMGTGKGRGFTVNVPLSPGCGDAEYMGIFEMLLKPIASEFNPELVLVSAGFDCFIGDPIGAMKVTPDGFAAMTRALMEIAQSSCQGKLVFTLEGGYNIRGQRDSIKRVLKTLAGMERQAPGEPPAGGNDHVLNEVIDRVKGIHSSYWKTL